MWRGAFAAAFLLTSGTFADESAVCRLAASYRADDFKAMHTCAMRPDHRSCSATVADRHFYGEADLCESPLTGVLEGLCTAAIPLPKNITIECSGENTERWNHALDTESGHLSNRSGTASAALRACDYISADERIVRCAGAYEAISHFVSISDSSACPSFYGFSSSGTRYASVAEAAAGAGCDTTCTWHYSTAVDGIRCGRRWGYSELRADSPSCPTLYNIDADGYFNSLAEYERTHPCP